MRIVFWQYMHVMHQSATLRALAKMGHQVISVAEKAITKQQVSLGYFVPDFGQVQAITNPDLNTITELAQEKVVESIHIIGGIRGYQMGIQALEACKKAGAHIGWLVEGGDPRGIQGIVRRLIYTYQAFRFRKYVDFILAMGENGVRWYQSCGWPTNRVFPYAYITEAPKILPNCNSQEVSDNVKILYLGQLIPRKGIDLLLQALARLQDKKWQLTLIGNGAAGEDYERLARSLKIHDRLNFVGVLPNKEAMQWVATSDLIVLPSRFDGWGAVTNEGLMCGIPVVCSSSCGSSDLLRENWRGSVFNNLSVAELSRELSFWIDQGKNDQNKTKRIMQWSQRITGEAAAIYIDSIIKCVYHGDERPVPPWY